MEKINGAPFYWLASSKGILLRAASEPAATWLSIAEPIRHAMSNLEFFIEANKNNLPLSVGNASFIVANLKGVYEGKNVEQLKSNLSDRDRFLLTSCTLTGAVRFGSL